MANIMKEGEYFDEIETWPIERLRELQFKKLKSVLKYAYRDLGFYRRRFEEAGVHPNDIKSFDDFSRKVPTFKKADIIHEIKRAQDYRIGIEALKPYKLTNIIMTSGTLSFHTFASITEYELRWSAARAVLRGFWMMKMRPGMKVMMLSPAWHYLSLLDNMALSRLNVKCLSPWGTHVPKFSRNFLEVVLNLKPDYFLTTATVLYFMLGECERLGVTPEEVFRSVKYIASVGEPITPRFRKRLVEELGVEDIFERGGSSDGLWGGDECYAHRGHHPYMDYYYLEVLDPRTGEPLPSGKKGTVVVTNLSIGKSLYIRFNCEDLGEIIPENCTCGRTHNLIELYDRVANVLVVKDRTMTAYDVRQCIDKMPELCGSPFFVVRYADSMSHLKLLVKRPSRGNPEEIANGVRRLVREGTKVEAEVKWIEGVPTKWKGRVVTEEEIGGDLIYPRE